MKDSVPRLYAILAFKPRSEEWPQPNLTMTVASQPRKRWYDIQWYADADTPDDRKLINKLDLLIVPYAVLSYWVKYLDQSNLSKNGYEYRKVAGANS